MKKIKFKNYLIAILFFSLPIMLSSQYYIDDMGRAAKGYTRWGIDGRPVSDWLMQLLSFNHRLIDIFPLPLILSCLLMALTLYMFHKKYIVSGGVFFLVPLGYILSPSLPEMLSYRFDVLPMTLSLCAPLLLISKTNNNYKIDFLLSIVTTTIVFCTYQPSINLYVFCCIIQFLYVLDSEKKHADALKIITTRVFALAVSAIVYMKVILPNTFSGIHSANHPGVVDGNLLATALTNINVYYNFLNYFFFHEHAAIYFTVICCVVLSCCIKIVLKYKGTKINASLVFVYLTLSLLPFASIIATMASLLPLENAVPYFSRLYVGIGGLNLLCFYCFYLLTKDSLAKVLMYLTIIPITYFAVYIYAFGAASKAQSEYTSVVINDIKNSLNGVNFNYIVFNGQLAKSPILLNSQNNFPIFKYNIPNYFFNWYWPYNRFTLEGLYLPNLPSKEMVDNSLINMYKSKLTVNSRLYNLHIVNDVAVVDFDRKCKQTR
ncbi:glucosyltransferase domain-containing protein [Escherichia coli]|nr:glucosyltransferase domain-containing protein [Escherichia coli]